MKTRFTYSFIEKAIIGSKAAIERANKGKNPEYALYLGYPIFDNQGAIDYSYGSVDFLDGELKSFTFEKISRSWSEAEWKKYVKDGTELPDPVQYGYVGGTYSKA